MKRLKTCEDKIKVIEEIIRQEVRGEMSRDIKELQEKVKLLEGQIEAYIK